MNNTLGKRGVAFTFVVYDFHSGQIIKSLVGWDPPDIEPGQWLFVETYSAFGYKIIVFLRRENNILYSCGQADSSQTGLCILEENLKGEALDSASAYLGLQQVLKGHRVWKALEWSKWLRSFAMWLLYRRFSSK